jgi:hypothetical protein
VPELCCEPSRRSWEIAWAHDVVPTAVRRKSCRILPGTLAALDAVVHALRKSRAAPLPGFPFPTCSRHASDVEVAVVRCSSAWWRFPVSRDSLARPRWRSATSGRMSSAVASTSDCR